jgi:hypothetical protein
VEERGVYRFYDGDYRRDPLTIEGPEPSVGSGPSS